MHGDPVSESGKLGLGVVRIFCDEGATARWPARISGVAEEVQLDDRSPSRSGRTPSVDVDVPRRREYGARSMKRSTRLLGKQHLDEDEPPILLFFRDFEADRFVPMIATQSD